MAFFSGFGVSALVYCGLNYLFPPAGKHAVFDEVDISEADLEGDDGRDRGVVKDQSSDNSSVGDMEKEKGGASALVGVQDVRS